MFRFKIKCLGSGWTQIQWLLTYTRWQKNLVSHLLFAPFIILLCIFLLYLLSFRNCDCSNICCCIHLGLYQHIITVLFQHSWLKEGIKDIQSLFMNYNISLYVMKVKVNTFMYIFYFLFTTFTFAGGFAQWLWWRVYRKCHAQETEFYIKARLNYIK